MEAVASGDELLNNTQSAGSSPLSGSDPHLFMPQLELVVFAEAPNQGCNSSNDSYSSLDSSPPFRPMDVSESHPSHGEGNSQNVYDIEEHGSDESFPCLILEHR